MARHPREPYSPTLLPQRPARRVHILVYCDELLTPFELDDVPGRYAHLNDLLDSPCFHGQPQRCVLALLEHVQILRTHDETDTASFQHVRDSDETRDELGGGPLVDLEPWPAMRRSSVVLPEPDGPSRVKNSPARTVRSTPATAST